MRGRRKNGAEFINALSRVISPGEDRILNVEEKVSGETILMNPQRNIRVII